MCRRSLGVKIQTKMCIPNVLIQNQAIFKNLGIQTLEIFKSDEKLKVQRNFADLCATHKNLPATGKENGKCFLQQDCGNFGLGSDF